MDNRDLIRKENNERGGAQFPLTFHAGPPGHAKPIFGAGCAKPPTIELHHAAAAAAPSGQGPLTLAGHTRPHWAHYIQSA